MDYKDWQKQFREKFTLDCGEDYGICLTELYPYKIESFISSLLQQKDQEYTDKIKKYFSETHQMDLSCESLINFIK